MDAQLRKHDVWVVLMPQSRYTRPRPSEYYGATSYHALQGLERNLDWRLVFINNKQRLYVNIKTPQGKALYDGIFDGSTVYPDEFHSNLIRAHCWLFYSRTTDKKKGFEFGVKGFDFAKKAFELNQSPTPMLEIILLVPGIDQLKPQVQKFCEDYIRRFTENGFEWAKEDGYRNRVEAARLAGFYLENIAKARKNTELMKFYQDHQSQCVSELIRLSQIKRW
jgi:hypothetical protein